MKLIRFGEPNRERPGLLLPDGRRIDASGCGSDYDEAFFGSGGLERLAHWLERERAAAPVVPDGVRLGPPLCRPSKLVCVASTTATTPANRAWRSRTSRSSSAR